MEVPKHCRVCLNHSHKILLLYRKCQLLLHSVLMKQNKHFQSSHFYYFIETQFLLNSYINTGLFHFIIVVNVVCISNNSEDLVSTSWPYLLQQTAVYHKDTEIKAAAFIWEIYINFLTGIREASLTFSKRAVFNSACSVSLCFFFCSKDSFNSLSLPWRCCSHFSFSFRRPWISSICALAASSSIDNCLEIYIQKY